ncbi:MAG: prepilin-type N-terminal cleavage/methylation domain-containing protein [Alphaproteobacteria bacterium]|nr:prepilin-type N-terminal cleavage/methylation domain-containing protein [Alphaproteobacteria bacterium]
MHHHHPSRRDINSSAGFTLVEMSIVLIIMSVVVGGSFAIATNFIRQNKEKTTQEHLDLIEKALLDFRKANNRLPCPADGSVNPDNTNYGIEAANDDAATYSYCTGGTPAANFVSAAHATKTGNPATYVVGGSAPVTTLGLPKEVGFDGWGNKISYHVDGRATQNGAFSTFTISNSNCFNIIIDNELTWNDDADRNYLSFHAAYALVSHGKDGHGAFSKGGPRLNSATTNSFQQQNANYDATGAATTYNNLFHIIPESENPADNKDVYDDLVRFKTRSQLRTTQDGPGVLFPDLIISANDPSNVYGTHFFYRCGDQFQYEPQEMVDVNNKQVQNISISPNNTYILGSTKNDYHFRMWTYDGVKTHLLTDSSFIPFPNLAAGTAETAIWSPDGEYFLVAALDDGDEPNRISIYEKTGINEFTRIDAAVENALNSKGNAVLSEGALYGLNVSPDGNEMVIMYGNGALANAITPMLYKRNADNSFSYVADGIPEMPAIQVRKPIWSPDGAYLLFMDWDGPDLYLFRNDGNNHYSRIASPSPAPANAVGNATFSPDSRFLVTTGYSSSEWNIYELQNSDEYTRISPHPGTKPYGARSVQFSKDGRYLVVGKFRHASNPDLYLYKVNGSVFEELTSPEGFDVELDGHIMHIEWRKLMPWEESS